MKKCLLTAILVLMLMVVTATSSAENSIPASGSTSFNRSDTSSFMVLTETPTLTVSPESHNFGDVVMGYVGNQDFSVLNTGDGTISVNSINISGSTDFTITVLPVLPAQISLGTPISFHVKYAPSSAGNHTATVSITDNLRLIHTVELSGHGVDHTIYELGYMQNFDGVDNPYLPPDWNKICADPGYVITITGAGPQSPPNCLSIAGSTNFGNAIMLIAPPLAPNIPLNTVRVKFWEKGFDCFLDVGVMTDPEDPNTFSTVATFSSGSSWVHQQVSLSSYTGNGRFIAFRLAPNHAYQVIYIDTVELELMGENDLKAVGLSGNSMPIVNTATQYLVSVSNNSSAPQSTYAVKLFDDDNVELASTTGTFTINPGSTIDVAVSWTPMIQGPMSIHGRVVLAGDVNPANDSSKELSIGVQPVGAIPVTIGIGDDSYIVPIDFSADASIYENIYYAAEIGTPGTIHTIAMYNEFNDAHIGNRQVKIWMGLTNQQLLTNGWISSNLMTLVFDGMIKFPGGENTIVFPLQTPFVYTGDSNLVVLFQHPMDGQDDMSHNHFKTQIGVFGRSLLVCTSGFDPNPATPPGAAPFGTFPKTTFMITPAGRGHVIGTVRIAGGSLLTDVHVDVDNGAYSAVTNSQGQFSISNVPVGQHIVSFRRYGYEIQTINIDVSESETVIMNVTMNLLPRVTVTGHIWDHDTGNGIVMANIYLFGSEGWEQFSTTSLFGGYFSIPNVIANQNYTYTAYIYGYLPTSGTIDVGAGDFNMGDIFLGETAYYPVFVSAEANAALGQVNLSWTIPDQPAPVGNSRNSGSAKSTLLILEGYRAWRLKAGQEYNEASWISLSAEVISTQNIVDQGWGALPDDVYRWAVKAIYAEDLISAPAFSKLLVKGVGSGCILGSVTRENEIPAVGATITVEGGFGTTTDATGAYSLNVPVGVYWVSVAFGDYDHVTRENIIVLQNQNSTINFNLNYSSTEDEIVPIAGTALHCNYPNPFNPETTISYDLKDAGSVRLNVYNIKGQMVRSLVNTDHAAGSYRVVFNGRDDKGSLLASGVYLYRLTAGRYSSTRKMILMK